MGKSGSFVLYAVTIIVALIVAIVMPLLVFFGGFPLVFHTYYDASSDHGFGHAVIAFIMVVINVLAFPITSFFFVRSLIKRQNKARFFISVAIMLVVSFVIQVVFSMIFELPILVETTS